MRTILVVKQSDMVITSFLSSIITGVKYARTSLNAAKTVPLNGVQ